MKLFQSIFGGREETHGRYPESLIEAAIERAVDTTDSRIRLLPGYRKHLRGPVIHAIDHVISLVDRIPAPVSADKHEFTSAPALAALYASAADMLDQFSRDRSLTDYLASPEGRDAGRITALVLAERGQRTVFGIDLTGDIIRREVPQVAVCFTDHNLVDPRASEEEARRHLKRRAFDHLLFLALTRIGEVRIERADLARQRDLLRGKLAAFKRGGLTFNPSEGEHPDPATLESELDSITDQLASLGRDDQVLQTHLEIVAESLGQAEHLLWSEPLTLFIDPMNIERTPHDPAARRIDFEELHNAREQRLVMQLVSFSPSELPAREDLVAAAERYLY
ncbi:hypothetical protein [uncultured Thiodictyon sp.]|uniref:hypothetical protein n=1 Tax=uncultured Thiodictyon sp. TaxID=1846217 RepID=UPI0025E0E697|nr:hypothetical protein [uncultured Thiodictyon sp.]